MTNDTIGEPRESDASEYRIKDKIDGEADRGNDLQGTLYQQDRSQCQHELGYDSDETQHRHSQVRSTAIVAHGHWVGGSGSSW